MQFQVWALLLVALINFILLSSLGLRSSRSKADRLFIFAIFFNVLWALGDAVLIGANDPGLAAAGAKIFFVAPMYTAYFLLIFSKAFHDRSAKFTYRDALLAVPVLLLSVFLLRSDLPQIITSIQINDSTNTFEVDKLGFTVYTAYFSLYFSLSYFVLFFKALSKKGKDRAQIFYIFYAAIISSFLALLSNLSLPLLGDSSHIWLGPVFTLFYVIIVTFAIVKHQLFDIRSAVARTVAYAVSVLVIIGIFIGLVTLLSTLEIFTDQSNINLRRIFFIALAIMSAIIYQPIKKFFDKLTNTLFYRDAYDAQAFIDDFNETLVSTVGLEELLQKTASLIEDNLKTTGVIFYLRETGYFAERIVDSLGNKVEITDVNEISEQSASVESKVYSTELEDDQKSHPKLHKLLRKNDFSIMLRLVSSDQYQVKGAGLLFIGHRRSGSLYTSQDMKVLSIVANELIIAIENILRYEEIEQFNVTLQKKTDSATKELQQSNQKLLALDQAKDEFVSMASHQLRTPLTSIKGYVSMVLDGDAGEINDSQRQMLSQTFMSSQRMVYLIADLLNVSRLKTGKFHIDSKPVALDELVKTELVQLEDEIKNKNLKLKIKLPDTVREINLDEMKTRQVVMNFVDNAIYYTPKGGTIDVTVKQDDKTTEFTVKDSGIGVPKEQQAKLFTKFYRAENARKIRPDGTGLGLFMAKKVIEAQSGEVIFSSKENHGSTFGFRYIDTKQRAE